jgi:putative transposase
MIDNNHPQLSVRRQCELVGLNRATFYRQPLGETPFNLQLMREIDEIYTRTPFYGYRKITVCLKNRGRDVNHKRVGRLMNVMGIQAIYPQPRTSIAAREHKKYPYLLRGLAITHPNQVWSTDITYIPMPTGFMYLVAVIDWYSRFVLSWQLSNTLDSLFCTDALRLALQQGQPEIFNSDQGVQFTATAFTGILEAANIRISMDGRGRAFDNIFIERLWRNVKYEDVYIKGYQTVPALVSGLSDYFYIYNYERPHQSLDYLTPAQCHFQKGGTAPQVFTFVNQPYS